MVTKSIKIKIALGIGIAIISYGVFKGNIPLFSTKTSYSKDQVLGADTSPKPEVYKPYWVFDSWKGAPLPASPEIAAQSALAINLDKNQVFFEKDKNSPLKAASTVKIMTAALALENRPEDFIVTVSPKASSMEPDSMGLFPGEKLTIKQLVQGLMMVSGNDASEAIAEGISGSREKFVELMNQKAKELGMKNTHFANPSGLEGDGDHFSTVSDLALLSKYALTNPTFADIVSKSLITIPWTVNETENHKNYYLENTSPMVNYPGYLGIKPGFTPEAMKCLVTLVEVNNQRILVVVLGSDDRKGDTEKLLDYAKYTL